MLTALYEKIKTTVSDLLGSNQETGNFADHLLGKTASTPPLKKTIRRVYKGRDTTKFTKHQFDYIQAEYHTFCMGGNEDSKQFTARLNALFGLNKSFRSYCRVGKGEVARCKLPEGEVLFKSNRG